MSRGTPTTPFRIPPVLKARAQARAAREDTTLTAVVIAALEAYAPDEPTVTLPAPHHAELAIPGPLYRDPLDPTTFSDEWVLPFLLKALTPEDVRKAAATLRHTGAVIDGADVDRLVEALDSAATTNE